MEKFVKVRFYGVERPKGQVSEELDRSRAGHLVIRDTDSQGRHRLMKVARFTYPTEDPALPQRPQFLYRVELGTFEAGKLRLLGIERARNEKGEVVEFSQEWLCETVPDPAEAPFRGYQF